MCGPIFTADGRIGGGLPLAVCINIHAAAAPPVKKAEKSCSNSFHKSASKHKYSNVHKSFGHQAFGPKLYIDYRRSVQAEFLNFRGAIALHFQHLIFTVTCQSIDK